MGKIIPLQASEKRRVRKPRTARTQIPTTRRTSDEEGMVTILLKDGTSKTIIGTNLELDVQYRDGVPYLVVKARR